MEKDKKIIAGLSYDQRDVKPFMTINNKSECPNCSAKENNWAKHCNECNFIGCYQCIDEHSHTPHESEDWEAEFDKKYKKMVEELYPDYRESYNYKILKDIKSFIRKAYQRGREEALSLAVQEIGKEIQKIKNSEAGFDPFDAFEAGVFQGLDKAKSIISGVMKK